MHNSINLTLLAALFLGSCAPAQTPPAQPPFGSTQPAPATATQTVIPSRTPIPTQTIIPTATPYPPLQTDGPYLLFTYDNQNFTIMDADGSGQKQFQLPNAGYIWNLEQAVSPDGNWLVYFTGSVDEPYDLALNRFNLMDETSWAISDLIATGFPENLEPLKETVWYTEFDGDCANNPTCQLRAVEISFNEGIWRFDWSPDSQRLAFAAQIDGPSSDVYIFDITDKAIQRLTNELENIGLMISWSPDGKKILYESSQPGATYSYYHLNIVDPALRTPQHPNSIVSGSSWHGEGWINENSYMISSGGDGAPPHHFRYLDTDTLQTKEIWDFAAESFFLDTQQEKIIMLSFPEGLSGLETEPEAGLYFVTLDGNYSKITSEIYTPLQVPGPTDIFFVLQLNSFDEMNELIKIEADGKVESLSRKIYYSNPPRTSPNGKWVLIASDKGTELYSEELQIINSWDFYSSRIIWRPDSVGAFLFIETKMYFLSIPEGELRMIADCTQGYCPDLDSVWLP